MANYQKLQTATGLNIVSTDNANIPFPNVIETGISGSVSANQLEDVTGQFLTLNVQIGDVVYNNTTLLAAAVTRVLDEENLLLNANIFLASGDSYTIYSQNGKEACVLYVGTGGKLSVITASGQDVFFKNILGGSFLPVQVLKVFKTGTTATDLVALW
jgi:hypothetical protein